MSTFDCTKCPGYCCSYPVISVDARDIARLAAHLKLSPEEIEARYVKSGHGEKRILKRNPDPYFGKICKLFDRKLRRCGAYAARPEVCRRFPKEGRCGYYDFLVWEREHQDDPEFVATTDNGAWA